MPEISGIAIAALVVLVVLLIYGVAWRLTRGRSLTARTLVRGGLAVLILGPLLLLALPTYRSFDSESMPPEGSPSPSLSDEEARERVR